MAIAPMNIGRQVPQKRGNGDKEPPKKIEGSRGKTWVSGPRGPNSGISISSCPRRLWGHTKATPNRSRE
ncbi:hypothetical protein K469DRAFT_700906 [Zopfia rhizophila CBS 207.26]|uniref:Uncharacterized protein n=1 Tax=Zopfia rhizophila CBS 207.26 TaxID=1314779 RepID=A0A6A6EHR9_9PEZI|nr:hypothetical protein K469DRAFT_700906 [Zopfia rhizophila CBS 207.26]